jgi:competence ComEA-like helix-hairpin-helix protein
MLRVGLFIGLALAASGWAQGLPDGAGKELVNRVCTECHGVDRILNLKLNREAWKTTVDRMAAQGANATKEEFEAILTYLAKNLGAEADAPKAVTEKDLPEGPGKVVILRECTACHAPDHFTKYHHSPEEWQVIVTRMGQRVRSATTAELNAVQQYLSVNFPKTEDSTRLNMNKATAKDIQDRLGLTPKEAQAIVQYRNEHGDFREWGEMLVVYGVDGRKIKAVKDLMSF